VACSWGRSASRFFNTRLPQSELSAAADRQPVPMMSDKTPNLPVDVRRQWARLAMATDRHSSFDPAMVDHLPEPARRWLGHAITPGAPLLRSVELAMHGMIRVGSWRRFEASQVLVPPAGFVWAATTRLAGLSVQGYDRYSNGTGEMQ
jgi:hypothetical protein